MLNGRQLVGYSCTFEEIEAVRLINFRTTSATASYRLLPTIDIITPILPELCDKFAACFPPGVVVVEEDSKGRKTARVADARKDTVSREVLRHPEFENSVRLGRKRDHFICG